jgi:flagellar basal body-associated protein FliL
MSGTVAIVIVLLLFPVLFLMAAAVVTMVFGWALNDEVDAKHEGSESLALAYPEEN